MRENILILFFLRPTIGIDFVVSAIGLRLISGYRKSEFQAAKTAKNCREENVRRDRGASPKRSIRNSLDRGGKLREIV